MKSKIAEFINLNKKGLSVLLFFFLLLVIFLFLTNSHSRFHDYAIIISFLIFIIYQYFNIDYRIFLSFALILLLFCPFLLIFKEGHYQKNLAEYFASYACGFIVLGISGYFFDNLKNRIRTKRIFKIFIFVIIGTTILLSIFILYKDYKNNESYIVAVESFYKKSIVSTKNIFLRTFNKEIYYSKKDFVIIDGVKVKEDIIINIDYPKKDSNISGIVNVKGWVIEKNSIRGTGIDKIEFFLNGKPGKGKYLGKFSQNYNAELETINYIENLYSSFYNRLPTGSELYFWAKNLEYNFMSYNEVAVNIIDESKFMEKGLSNEDFTSTLYRGLLNSDWDGSWADKLETGLTREDLLYIIINSIEFNKLSENYYKIISIKEPDLSIFRIDVGDRYGKQFYLSGFDVYLDSTKVENGKYELYIYAHSPIFGWDYEILSFEIKN
ncbi:MAG: DUF4214 domain-containing protein [Actinobacteria bacterium]|nr:DUF4214 domain-containing protein [Actinomycetota bacterium]